MSMSTDDDLEILKAAREGFLDEARDMLQQFEQSLLQLESDPGDVETLNAAFRAAHTIKGTAGIFGCHAVVAFTHHVETLMEDLRSGRVALQESISAALLDSLDQMSALLEEVRTGEERPEVARRSEELGAVLKALQGGASAPAASAQTPSANSAMAAAPAGACDLWHISVRFLPDALRNGLDPLAIVRYLDTVGTVQAIHTWDADLPDIDALDPEGCHLGFEIQLQCDKGHDAIEEVFEFVMDDCQLSVLPADAPAADWAALLTARCEDNKVLRQTLAAVWMSQGIHLGAKGLPPDGVELREAVSDRRHEVPDRRTDADRRTTTPTERRGAEVRFVKVRADKLDRLIDLIGELVIAGSGAQMVANAEGHNLFLEATQKVSELVQQTRDGALALRMVPIGETFSRFQRVVRDISKQLGKDIDLTVTGGDTEMDKSMVELITDPLMHLVRNSLDHGIETTEERLAAGKPEQGRLGLHAYQEAGAIVIEVSDDGRGLQRERILRKATERGLIAADAELSDAEVWNLVFAPGFSTAEAVTDLSGRGVGMDVVRRNIESLRGQISLVSQEGLGTTTQIRLPLTLAMIDGFLTVVANVHYVLPLSVVSECIDVPAECKARPDRVAGTFDLRGEVLPYLDLALLYGAQPQPGARRSLIVVADGHQRMGLVVDRLMGEHQTVIKPLASIFKHLEAVAGSTIMGSGEVALVLDLHGLMAAARRLGQATRRAPPATSAVSVELTERT